MKKLALLLALMLLVTCNLALADTKQYTFETAFKQALEKNVDLLSIVQKVEIAKRQIYLANAAASGEKDRSYISDSDKVTSAKTVKLFPLQRQWDLDKLELDKIDQTQQIELDIIKGMYGIDRAKKGLANYKADRVLMEKELVLLKAKFKLGLATQTQIDTQQLTLDKNALETSIQERQLQKEFVSFNHIIGNPLDTTITLGSLPNLARQEKAYDLSKIALYNYDHATVVLDKQKQITFKKLDRDILFDEMLFVDAKQRETLNQDVAVLENDLAKLKRSTEVAIHKAQIGIENAKLDLKIAELDYQIAKRAYDTEKTRLALGLTSQMELLKVQETLRLKADALILSQVQLFESIDSFEKTYFISKIN